MGAWKNNKRIQVAVGLAVLFLALRWLYSPTLQEAAWAYTAPEPAEGDVANPASLALIWPVIELGIAFLAGLGVFILNIGDWLWSQIQGAGVSTADEQSTAPRTMLPEQIQQDLTRAVAMNDEAERQRLEVIVRRPHALNELNLAVFEGDVVTAREKFEELLLMAKADVPAKPVEGKR